MAKELGPKGLEVRPSPDTTHNPRPPKLPEALFVVVRS